MPYPPGVSSDTSRGPWNAPDVPQCPECDNHIREVTDHTKRCDHKPRPEQIINQRHERDPERY